MISIEKLSSVTTDSVGEINALMKELRSDATSDALSTPEDMAHVLGDKDIIVVAVKDDERIVGIATLYVIPKIGKKISHVEDVVVSSAYRGQGLGEKLIRKVIEIAKENGVSSIGLTSRPSREAANKLYQKVGFTQKETNVYRMSF